VAFCAVWAHAVTSGTWVWPLMLAWGASGGAMYAACITGLGKKFSTRNLAAATTGYLMMWESGALFGPFLVGVAMDIWDPHGMAIVLALLGVVLVAVTLSPRFNRVGKTIAFPTMVSASNLEYCR
jgi:hypothetical protein